MTQRKLDEQGSLAIGKLAQRLPRGHRKTAQSRRADPRRKLLHRSAERGKTNAQLGLGNSFALERLLEQLAPDERSDEWSFGAGQRLDLLP